MRTDMVVVKSDLVEKFRKTRMLSRFRLFHALQVAPRTGQKLITGKPVSVAIAQKAATLIGVGLAELIERWVGDEQTASK